jgi:hypothetical protein
VGDDNDCSIIPVQIVKQREDAIGRFAVDGACRLIGEDQSGFIYDCPSNRDALLLATGQLMRPMIKSTRKTDPVQGILRFAPPFAASHASKASGNSTFSSALDRASSEAIWNTNPISRQRRAARRLRSRLATSSPLRMYCPPSGAWPTRWCRTS